MVEIRGIRSRGLPDYGVFYYQNVLAEYEAAVSQAGVGAPHPCRDMAERLKQQPAGEISCAELFSLEIAVARLQPVERVRQRLCVLREKYRALMGESAYEHYVKCVAVDLKNASELEVRTEIETLLGEFHWHYSATKTRDALFDSIRRTAFYGLLLLAGVGAVIFIAAQSSRPIPGLLVVMLAGLLGAFVSMLRRLQEAQRLPVLPTEDPVAKILELGLGKMSIYVALASGLVFPLVLLLLFTATLVESPLFPAMYTQPEALGAGASGMTFLDFAVNTGPKTGADFAKLLVWSFIAGFAERFVPDVLDKLVMKSGQKEDGPAPRPGGPPALAAPAPAQLPAPQPRAAVPPAGALPPPPAATTTS